jgi:ATP-dependent Clp protease ATP-binding subunit ClpX
MESVLLDTMFDLPSMRGVEEIVVSADVIEGRAPPLQIYSERRNGQESAG